MPSRPLSSADLRVVQIPPGPDHPGGTLYEVASRWSDIAPDNAKDVAAVAADRDLWMEAIEREAESIKSTFKPVPAKSDEKPIDTVWVFKAKVNPVTGKVDTHPVHPHEH